MEILFWLLPAALVTVGAMLWVAWVGRVRPGEDDEVVLERMGEALTRPLPRRYSPLR